MKKIPLNDTKPSDGNVKYYISNTKIPVIITIDDEILFVVDKEEQAKFSSNPALEAKYKEDMNSSFEYLVAEGFMDEIAENKLLSEQKL